MPLGGKLTVETQNLVVDHGKPLSFFGVEREKLRRASPSPDTATALTRH